MAPSQATIDIALAHPIDLVTRFVARHDWLVHQQERDAIMSACGRMLLIIDGFDEAGDQRPKIMAWLGKCNTDITVVLISRPSGIDDLAMSSGTLNSGSENFLQTRVLNVLVEQGQLLLSKHLPVGKLK